MLQAVIALIQHGFNGKGHSGFDQQSLTGISVMENLRLLVHLPADAMTTILSYNAVTGLRCHALNGMSYIAKTRPRFDGPDTCPHGLIGGINQAPCFRIHLADAVHLA